MEAVRVIYSSTHTVSPPGNANFQLKSKYICANRHDEIDEYCTGIDA